MNNDDGYDDDVTHGTVLDTKEFWN